MDPTKLDGPGRVVVLKKSKYESLEEAEQSFLTSLKTIYCSWGADRRVYTFFNQEIGIFPNPYVTVLKLMYNSGDFYSSRSKSLCSFVVTMFADYLKTHKADIVQLEGQIKLEALSLVMQQKNNVLRDLVIKVFEMADDKDMFFQFINECLNKKQFKEACQISRALKIYSFSPEDFLLPLCVQDKLSIVEDYIGQDEGSRMRFLKYMDQLLAGDTYSAVYAIIDEKKIPDWKVTRCGSKPIKKFLERILKKHNLPPETCPNMVKCKQMSVLHYLLAKRFDIDKTGSSEGWMEMVQDAVRHSKELQRELVECLYRRGYPDEAVSWATLFELPDDQLPYGLQDNASCSPDRGDSVKRAFANSLSDAFSQYLTIPEEKIVFVNDANGFEKFLQALHGQPLVGFDIEWKPRFGTEEPGDDMAILQVATRSHAFVLDRPTLAATVENFSDILIERLFHNADITKVGFGLEMDIKVLSTVFPNLKQINNLIDILVLRTFLVERHNFRFPFGTELSVQGCGGKLADITEWCLGKKLDKTEQCSNWDRRPLRPTQLQYAALDAYCLIDIYDVISRECSQQGISLETVIKEMKTPKSPKKSKADGLGKVAAAGPCLAKVKDLHVVCTRELFLLLKRLRQCGIDALYCDSIYPSRKISNCIAKRRYLVLTSVSHPWLGGLSYLRVPAVQEEAQLHFVLTNLHVELLPEDYNSRCQDCNSTEISDFSGERLKEMKEHAKRSQTVGINFCPPEEISDADSDCCDDYYSEYEPEPVVESPTYIAGPCMLSRLGASIKHEEISMELAEKFGKFYLCDSCGTIMCPVTLEDMFSCK